MKRETEGNRRYAGEREGQGEEGRGREGERDGLDKEWKEQRGEGDSDLLCVTESSHVTH